MAASEDDQKMSDIDELLTNTPYLRRLREKREREGYLAGYRQGYLEGEAEGIAKGKQLADHRTILDVLIWRFDPPASTYQEIGDLLTLVIDDQQRKNLRKAATQAQTLADFQSALQTLITDQSHLGNRTEVK